MPCDGLKPKQLSFGLAIAELADANDETASIKDAVNHKAVLEAH